MMSNKTRLVRSNFTESYFLRFFLITLSISAILKALTFRLNFRVVISHRKVTDETELVDIDIGTRGRPIKSKLKLITFDPGDKLHIGENREIYPYVIGNIDGTTTFYVNEDYGSCSSLKIRNNHFNSTLFSEFETVNCAKHVRKGNIHVTRKCMHGRIRPVSVNSTRLSSFLKKRNILHINLLKIDAQGSDLEIVIDLFQNHQSIKIKKLVMECQIYNKAIPLYHASNDCDEAVRFMKSVFPSAQVAWESNSCVVNEFNLIFTNLILKNNL